MPAEAAAKDDRAASVTPAIRPTAPWRVQEVTALPDDRLFVRFVDGLTGIVDLSALIASPQAGVFARLRDRTLFEQVHVEMGAVVWPGELDLAPDAMHAAIKKHGRGRLPRSCRTVRGRCDRLRHRTTLTVEQPERATRRS